MEVQSHLVLKELKNTMKKNLKNKFQQYQKLDKEGPGD